MRCFDLKTKASEKAAKRFEGKIEIFWGDMRKMEDLERAVCGCDVVIHTAFVIPHISSTGIDSEDAGGIARAINVGGTKNLIDAMEMLKKPPRLIFTSSLHIYGKTQHLEPPLKTSQPANPVENYARHKVECEEMIRSSKLTWSIYRLSAAMPVRLILSKGMFEVPLENRIEYVHPKDVAFALASGIESGEIWGKTLHIGGGKKCQLFYRDVARRTLEASGVGMLPDCAFSKEPFAVDWLDTEESERLLHYQRRTFDDYVSDLKKAVGFRRPFIKLFSAIIRKRMIAMSPYASAK